MLGQAIDSTWPYSPVNLAFKNEIIATEFFLPPCISIRTQKWHTKSPKKSLVGKVVNFAYIQYGRRVPLSNIRNRHNLKTTHARWTNEGSNPMFLCMESPFILLYITIDDPKWLQWNMAAIIYHRNRKQMQLLLGCNRSSYGRVLTPWISWTGECPDQSVPPTKW